MARSAFLFVLIILLSTCKKEDLELHITGNVFDPNQMITIAGASVVLSGKELSGGTFNNNFNTIASTTTNGNGHFEFQFERKTISEYRIRVSKDGYFEKNILITGDAIQANATYNVNIEAIPKAYYKLRLEDTSPIDDTDRISYRNINADLDCSCCNNQTVTMLGTDVDTSYTCIHEGAKWLQYYYEVEKNNNINSLRDSVYLMPFDTTENYIMY